MGEVEEPDELLSSGYSYFINKSLAEAHELRIESAHKTQPLEYTIIGLVGKRVGVASLVERSLGSKAIKMKKE